MQVRKCSLSDFICENSALFKLPANKKVQVGSDQEMG